MTEKELLAQEGKPSVSENSILYFSFLGGFLASIFVVSVLFFTVKILHNKTDSPANISYSARK